MSARHDYTNPAFCQQEENLFTTPKKKVVAANNFDRIVASAPSNKFAKSNAGNHLTRIQRSESSRSFQQSAVRTKSQSGTNGFRCGQSLRHISRSDYPALPPKPGPKPASTAGSRYGSVQSIDGSRQTSSGRYALVPVEELSRNNQGRYAVLPAQHAESLVALNRIVKSQDNLDQFGHKEAAGDKHNLSDQFCSLPPMSPMSPMDENKLKAAFSTDFGSKSFILYDQKSQQKFTVVPTEDNEEFVDADKSNEIIQMHNGRAHRYAVIPTEDEDEEEEEETCLSNESLETTVQHKYSTIREQRPLPPKPMPIVVATHRTPQKRVIVDQACPTPPALVTPRKANPLATQKLHELLSTPQKQMRSQGNTPRTTPRRLPPQTKIFASTPKQETTTDFVPQKLSYEQQTRNTIKAMAHLEARTTAVIIPRRQKAPSSVYSDSESCSKSWQSVAHNIGNATATIGTVTLMMFVCGLMNSGLSLYLTTKVSTSLFH
jgi:hypothetical protein